MNAKNDKQIVKHAESQMNMSVCLFFVFLLCCTAALTCGRQAFRRDSNASSDLICSVKIRLCTAKKNKQKKTRHRLQVETVTRLIHG